MSGLDNIGKRFGFTSAADAASQISDGFFGTDTLKDYSHASKLMRPNGLALAPKHKFLFHVYFNTSDPKKFIKSDDTGLVGALVKTIQLPSFRLDTKEYIQYNRKRLVHNRIMYEPINMTLHDDGSGNVLDMWNKYYQYYFSDSDHDYADGIQLSTGINGYNTYSDRNLYGNTLPGLTRGWGKTITTPNASDNKLAFFKDIKIYGFNRGGFVLYTLINPVITSWSHDTYDYAASAETMEHKVTLQYEAVKYLDSSSLGDDADNVAGFGEPSRYDREPGPLGPGSTTSTFGVGGITDTFGAVTTDLANGDFKGAIQKAGRSAKTFGDVATLKEVVLADSVDVTKGAILAATKNAPSRLLTFPTALAPTRQNIKIEPKKG